MMKATESSRRDQASREHVVTHHLPAWREPSCRGRQVWFTAAPIVNPAAKARIAPFVERQPKARTSVIVRIATTRALRSERRALPDFWTLKARYRPPSCTRNAATSHTASAGDTPENAGKNTTTNPVSAAATAPAVSSNHLTASG